MGFAQRDRGARLMRALRNLLYLAVGLMLGASISLSHAAVSIPISAPANVVKSSTGWQTAGSASFNAGAFNSGFTTQVAGKAVTMPAAWSMAANAGQYAVAAIRLSPSTLAVGAVAAWLLPYGLQWINNQFSVPYTQPFVGQCSIDSGTYNNVTKDACVSMQQAIVCAGATNGCRFAAWAGPYGNIMSWYPTGAWGGTWSQTGCPAGTTSNGTACVGAVRPANDSDWAAPAASALPSPAATELAGKGVAIPLQNPQIDPSPVDVPLSPPYVDPVTGKRMQDRARVTPNPDGTTAIRDDYRVEVDPAGNPVPGGTVEQAPEPAPEEEQVTPGEFGEVPDLYEKIYPDGLTGVLEEKTAQLKQTPLFGLVSQLAPTGIGNGGTCPSWTFDMNFGGVMNMGSKVVQPPCWIWDAIKAIMIVTALLTARKLIFGG